MGEGNDSRMVFFTLVQSMAEEGCALLLLESLRSFGGPLSQSPFWIFHAIPLRDTRFEQENVLACPLAVPDSVAGYELAGKVFACARAEELAAGDTRSLVWVSPEYIVLNPPLLFDLAPSFDAALRPVHIRNVGSPVSLPPDAYWRGVYDAVGVEDIGTTVESFVDGQRIRSYFNTHAFAVASERGLLGRWATLFESLVRDEAFQKKACADALHRIFLHQATLSALLATALHPERILLLPPEYNYPYNLHETIPEQRRARSLGELVGVVYEDRPMHPDFIDDIAMSESLASWLASHVEEKRMHK